MTGSNLIYQLEDVLETACKGCSVMESPFIRAPGIPFIANKKKEKGNESH